MIYSLVTTLIVPGKMAEYQEIVPKEVVPLNPKVGLKLVGSWHAYTGDMNAVYNLLVFDDLAALQKSRELQRTVNAYAKASEKISALRVSQINTILEPNSWSPLK
jgi:hypothetical protein